LAVFARKWHTFNNKNKTKHPGNTLPHPFPSLVYQQSVEDTKIYLDHRDEKKQRPQKSPALALLVVLSLVLGGSCTGGTWPSMD